MQKIQYPKGKGYITGKEILESNHTCILLDDTNKYSKRLTLKICKNSIQDANVLVRGTKDTLDKLRVAMILCYRKHHYDDANDAKKMGSAMAAHLKIKYDGMWIEDYADIRDVLSKISSYHAREVYVRSYERLFSETHKVDTYEYGYSNRRYQKYTSPYKKSDKIALNTLEEVFIAACNDSAKTKEESTRMLLQRCVITAKDSPDKRNILSEICSAVLEYGFEKNIHSSSKDSLMSDMALYTLSLHGYNATIQQTKKRKYGRDITYIKISNGSAASDQFSFDTKNWNEMFCIKALEWILDNTRMYSDKSETYVIAEATA